jgi:hypothetical protein
MMRAVTKAIVDAGIVGDKADVRDDLAFECVVRADARVHHRHPNAATRDAGNAAQSEKEPARSRARLIRRHHAVRDRHGHAHRPVTTERNDGRLDPQRHHLGGRRRHDDEPVKRPVHLHAVPRGRLEQRRHLTAEDHTGRRLRRPLQDAREIGCNEGTDQRLTGRPANRPAGEHGRQDQEREVERARASGHG